MRLPRRRLLQLAAAGVAAPALPRSASALDYPTRPLRWILGFAPGGGSDTVTRIMAQWLSQRLGQSVVVENKPGASTNISIQAAVSSPPDGYTLLFVAASSAVNVTLFDNLPFNLLRDIAPVAGLIDFSLVMVVNAAGSAKTVPAFIANAKANPGKLTMASYGTGSTSHLAGELFKSMTGTSMIHVPYRGEAPALTDIIGGQVDMMFATLTGALPHLQSGALRVLAVAAKTRSEFLPEVPTVAGIGSRIRGEFLVRRRRPGRHAARDHREAQPRDQCGPRRPRHQGAARSGGDHADFLHAGRVRRLCGGRNRQVGQGRQGVRRQAGVGVRDRNRLLPVSPVRAVNRVHCPADCGSGHTGTRSGNQHGV